MDGCKIWTGPVSQGGKPRVWVDGKYMDARRKVWLDAGLLLAPDFRIRTICCNDLCVELTHLFLDLRGLPGGGAARGPRVEVDQVELRELHQKGLSTRQLARRFCVSQTTIRRLLAHR